MNHTKIFFRGLKYVEDAANNWYNRRGKLISVWHSHNTNPIYKKRLSGIIGELEDRCNMLSKTYSDFNEKQKVESREAGEQIIKLECQNGECYLNPNGVGTAVKLKDYVEGKFKCEDCGSDLVSEGSRNIDRMLFELKIKKS